MAEKQCADCEKVLPLTEFYVRGGRASDDNPTSYVTYCKRCLIIRTSWSNRSARGQSSVVGEQIVCDQLMRMGIPTIFGKDTNIPGVKHVDLFAHNVIRTEVKHSQADWNYRHDIASFRISFTHRQRQHDIPAELVILILDFTETDRRFYVLPSDLPYFRDSSGNVRKTVSIVFDSTGGNKKSDIPTDVVEGAQNAWSIIETERQRICEALKNGSTLMQEWGVLPLGQGYKRA